MWRQHQKRVRLPGIAAALWREAGRRNNPAAIRIFRPGGLAPLLLLPLALGTSASASSIPSAHAKAELVAEEDSIEPGQDSWLGLRFALESGWHIYWINPGDSGEPPRAQWHLPAGLRVGPIQWPTPQRIEDHSLVDYGYLSEVLLMVPIHPPADLPAGKSMKFGATVKWLVCRETCIPEQADLTLSLPIQKKEPRLPSHWHELFAKTRARLPRPAPREWKITMVSEKDQFVLSIQTGSPRSQATLFPLEPNQIENAAPQEANRLPRGVRLKLRKSDQLLNPLSHLKGVVEMGSGGAFVIDARVSPSHSNRMLKSPGGTAMANLLLWHPAAAGSAAILPASAVAGTPALFALLSARHQTTVTSLHQAPLAPVSGATVPLSHLAPWAGQQFKSTIPSPLWGEGLGRGFFALI